MTTASLPKREFPLRVGLKGRMLVLRPLEAQDREPMLRFVRSLPEQDLLFLQRDITQRAEADKWIVESAAGDLVTIVAWHGEEIVGYATYARGNARWTRHVAELRVVVAESVRNLGIGRLLLELVFEMALDEGVTKVVACMTPDQAGAQRLFKRLGFEQEAVLRDHARCANGLTYDLLFLSFHTRLHPEQRCNSCGTLVLSALSLEGAKLCSHCFELQYDELGRGG